MKNNLNKKLIGLMAVGITAGLMVCPMHVSANENDPESIGENDPDSLLSRIIQAILLLMTKHYWGIPATLLRMMDPPGMVPGMLLRMMDPPGTIPVMLLPLMNPLSSIPAIMLLT